MKNWKRMLLSLTISVGLLASAVPVMAAPQKTSVKVNDQAVEYATEVPIMDKGTTLVPLRTTLDAMDVKLTTATDDTITAVVDGKTITLKSKLTRINGVTYAPIRIVGDAAGYEVRWDGTTRTVLLVSKGGGTEAVQTGARGFMWEVEHNGNTVYLVGSMHIADDSFYPLRKEFEEAFAEADYLGVEIDISKAADEAQQKLIMDMGMYQDGTTLKDHVSKETYAKLGAILKQSGLQVNALDAFKPWVAESTLSSLKSVKAGYDASAGIDLYFIQKAVERKLPVLELESYESQLGMFDQFSNELQEKNLNAVIDNFGVLDDTVDQMAEMWKTGDDKGLLEFTNSMAVDPEYNKAMLIDRNIGMADKIDGYLKSDKKEEYFIVVGAGHFLGKDGVIQLLKDKGYNVVRK
ncbi:MAG TPA: polysaccharide biosynthesis protein GumN [Paenibacillus sp.]|uniref:TraB/GumN family protein n=1 Tax=Paenibacillus TaxID=44249 RepID=UPI000BA04416|nr:MULTISPECIES: TraB/GumN family protein [Paenibacillus]OZQ66167.1 polysaccharide biosynthesis protein GumN [Paenibacillus taichungensis]HBU83316.1 polysaccharide biosynthesis protein GumN [Paenibacillus sp.]